MKQYTFTFIGCKIGAIGAHHKITATTIGDSEESAKLKLYDTYEHIIKCKLIKTTNIDARIMQMVENWNVEKRAFSNIFKDDRLFFEIIGIQFSEIGTTSQTGNDILYYDVNTYKSGVNAIKQIKNA
jgi:hypothetical protein